MMNSETITLPQQLKIFLRLIKPVRSNFYIGMSQKIVPSVRPINFMVRLSHLISALEVFARDSERTLNFELGMVAQRGDATEAEISSAINKFDQVLNDLILAFHSVQSIKVGGEKMRAIDLLIATYRHTFRQIQTFLDDLVDALDNPLAAIQKKGLSASGYVEITFTLKLTTGDKFEVLKDWIDRQSANVQLPSPPASLSKKSCGPGFSLLSVLAGIWLGSELGEHFFGGDEDC